MNVRKDQRVEKLKQGLCCYPGCDDLRFGGKTFCKRHQDQQAEYVRASRERARMSKFKPFVWVG